MEEGGWLTLCGIALAERNGESRHGEGHPRQKDRHPLRNDPSTQRSCGPSGVQAVQPCLIQPALLTHPLQLTEQLWKESPTLLVKLVSLKDELLGPVKTSLPAHAVCQGCFKTVIEQQ